MLRRLRQVARPYVVEREDLELFLTVGKTSSLAALPIAAWPLRRRPRRRG